MVHAIRDRFGGSSCRAELVPRWSCDHVDAMSVGVFFLRPSSDRASDTPVANPSFHPRASPTFMGAATWPYVLLWVGSYGSDGVESAKTTVDAVP
jgi:hypothetical protein